MNDASSRRRHVVSISRKVGLALAAWFSVSAVAENPGSKPDGPSNEPVASYRVELTRQDIDHWMRVREGAPFLRGQAALDGLALVKVLSERARFAGLHRQPRTRLELLKLHGKAARFRLRQEVTASIEVEPAAIEAYLEEHPIPDRPRRVRIRNIFRRFDSEAPGTLRGIMEGYRQSVLGGADFAELAGRVSESETRWRGGLMGNVRPGTLGGGELEQVVFSMQPGDLSPILESEDGLTLLFCEDVLEAVPLADAERRRGAHNRLWRRAFRRAWDDLLETLRRRGSLQILDQPEGIGLRYAGGYLEPEEVAALVGHDLADPWPSVGPEGNIPESWHRSFEAFVLGQTARLYQQEHNWRHGASTAEELDWQERRILTAAYLAHLVSQRFEEPNVQQIQDYFKSHRSRFEKPEVWHLSVIQLPRRTGQVREDTARAAALMRAIRRGEVSFHQAAEAHSQHVSSEDGGAVAPIAQPRLASRLGIDLTRAAKTLAVGDISELVVSDDSLWILQLRAKDSARPLTFEEAERAATGQWIDERLEELQNEVVEEILNALDLQILPQSGVGEVSGQASQ